MENNPARDASISALASQFLILASEERKAKGKKAKRAVTFSALVKSGKISGDGFHGTARHHSLGEVRVYIPTKEEASEAAGETR